MLKYTFKKKKLRASEERVVVLRGSFFFFSYTTTWMWYLHDFLTGNMSYKWTNEKKKNETKRWKSNLNYNFRSRRLKLSLLLVCDRPLWYPTCEYHIKNCENINIVGSQLRAVSQTFGYEMSYTCEGAHPCVCVYVYYETIRIIIIIFIIIWFWLCDTWWCL